jgi:hypothetical protein
MEGICPSETSVVTRTTERHVQEYSILEVRVVLCGCLYAISGYIIIIIIIIIISGTTALCEPWPSSDRGIYHVTMNGSTPEYWARLATRHLGDVRVYSYDMQAKIDVRLENNWKATQRLYPLFCTKFTDFCCAREFISEATGSSETSVLTRFTQRCIPEDGILQTYRRKNVKSDITLTGWAL